ncbi:MAG: tRNA epoxyqueuosine(34) reductase QueG [Alphaproteobacteria bacterium]|nr:tRNA epoxyqueuosine(34) reductase QueG [Alphaproteobacteria bacterium]MBO6627634.1 tRNA epoxyqueuosine(34) reductase QueG [Alphaproteobacteria bacterium]
MARASTTGAPSAPSALSATVAGLREEARAAGFDAVGIAPAHLSDETVARYRAWLAAGCHGDMQWMAETADRRETPVTLWPEAKSVILLAMSYGPDQDPALNVPAADCGNISVYARNKDYHDLVKKRLKRVARWLVAQSGADVKVFVDTAPVLEKPIAAQSTLGWQGKHTNLVSSDLGNWFFIGSIFTTLALEADPPHRNQCGSCQACLDACPTDAFTGPYRLDARRCISYLTIEHKGHIPDEFRVPMGNRIYGCDDCLAACPWNKFAQEASEMALQARDDLKSPPLSDLLAFDDAAFRSFFQGSPIKRIGRDRFIRNALIAAGNAHDQTLRPKIETLLQDESPLVRAMAVWAFQRLVCAEEVARQRNRLMPTEVDAGVKAEWLRSLSQFRQ